MKVLLISATYLEVAPLLSLMGSENLENIKRIPAGTIISIPTCRGEDLVSCLITGVGQASTAYYLGRSLLKGEWDLALQVGIAGAFSSELKKCQVVRVESEVFADLGAEDNGSYLDLIDMGLMQPNEYPFTEGRLKMKYSSFGPKVDSSCLDSLSSVTAVTVNRVLSESRSISWIKERYSPDIVSMEGASFFYAALLCGVPAIQIRSISDYVGPRDKSAWDIKGAITSLNDVVLSFLRPLLA